MDISMFLYPLEPKTVASQLRRKAGQLESSLAIEQERGMVRNPELETAIGDIESLRDVLQRGEAKLFQYSLYFTLYGKSPEELDSLVKQLESTLGGMLVYTKQALFQMEQGFGSTIPLGKDVLNIRRNLDTGSLSTTFPFISAQLSQNKGVLYGVNRHNNSLILFDRFSLENANAVVFAKAGAGKSYAIKLEALRSLMWGTDIIIIDPEDEYKKLCQGVGGAYISFSLNSDRRINPFDLPAKLSEGLTGADVLRSNVAMLHGLIGLMLEGLTPTEDALLDQAIYQTYQAKAITNDPTTFKNKAPLFADLQQALTKIPGAGNMGTKLSRFTSGTFAGLFNAPSNVDLNSHFIVFSIRDLEEELRPIAMYLILNFIWNQIRAELKKRILVIDEAWWMMQYEDSARFLFSLAKRARKYYLGLTVISQDVEDFLKSRYGRPVINNSSIQILMRQSPAAIDRVAQTFNLTEGEKFWLLEADIGDGLFFAGQNHVAIKVVASQTEDLMITSDPAQILAMKQQEAQQPSGPTAQQKT